MKIKAPYWIKVLWIIVLPGLLIYLNQCFYEILYLTYKIVPYMFGLPHIDANPTLGIFMIFSYFASILWIIIYTIWIIKIKIQKKNPAISWIYISTVFILVIINTLEPIIKALLFIV